MGKTAFSSAAGDGGCSTSIVSEDLVTGALVLRVECFSATKGLGIGNCIKSSPFSVGGHGWVIEYYPDGYDKQSKDFVSVYLRVDRRDASGAGGVVRARFKFTLVDKDGEPIPCFSLVSETKPFSQSWGFNKFFRRDLPDYLSSKCSRDGGDCMMNIKCEVTVVKFGVRTDDGAKKRRIEVPPSDLINDLGRLLSSEKGADVVFKVDGELVKAHRSVLAARSSVFDAELFGPMKEETADHRIRIEEMEPKVFRALLHFMYTDTFPTMAEGEDEVVMAQHLLVAADRYDLKRLKLMCEDKLSNHIDIGTVATTMALAEQHACSDLRGSCLEFLSSLANLKQIIKTEGYQHLKASCPSFLEELVDKIAAWGKESLHCYFSCW